MRVASGVAPRTWLYALVALTLAFKLWLSAVFPVTGDEAYFIDWGLRPAPGYYDHPPMVGWWLALLTQVSQAPWLLRLPATLMPAAMALTLYWALRRTDEDKAAIRLITAGTLFGRPLAAPPGVPADRIAALRAAFLATMKDPDFIKEAEAGNYEVDPVDGLRMQKIAEELIAMPASVKARARPLIE